MNRGSQPDLLEDVELIERIQAGQTECYAVLVRKYQDRVYNACWRICGHLEDARDLTQESFLKAFDSLPGFRKQSGFYTWLYRIAVNLALTHRRNTKRRRTVSFDRLMGESSTTQAEALLRRKADAAPDDPPGVAQETELQGLLVRALDELEPDQRAMVVLRDMEGFNYQQIAEVLSVPVGTVKSRLHRARITLRSAIEPALTRAQP